MEEIAKLDIRKMTPRRQIPFMASLGYGVEDIAKALDLPTAVIRQQVKDRGGWPSWWLA